MINPVPDETYESEIRRVKNRAVTNLRAASATYKRDVEAAAALLTDTVKEINAAEAEAIEAINRKYGRNGEVR